MTDPVADLANKARTLSPEDRARLAEEPLASLEGEIDAAVETAWDEALLRRIAEVDSGTAKLIPAADVFERVRRALG